MDSYAMIDVRPPMRKDIGTQGKDHRSHKNDGPVTVEAEARHGSGQQK